MELDRFDRFTNRAIVISYLFEVSRGLDFANGLHEGVANDDADVGTRVAVGLLPQSDEISFVEAIGGGAEVQLEHGGASGLLRERDVDALFKPVII